MTKIHHPHDALFKSLALNKEILIHFFNLGFGKRRLNQMDFTCPEPSSTDFIHKKLRQTRADVLYKIPRNGRPSYFLIEQQSTPDKKITLRCLDYGHEICRRHLQQNKNGKFPEIFALVLYHGRQSPYPYETKLRDYFENPKAGKLHHFFYQFKDLTRIKDHVLKRQGAASWPLLLFKHIFDSDLYHWAKHQFQSGLVSTWLKNGGTFENLEASIEYLLHHINLDSLTESDKVARTDELIDLINTSLNFSQDTPQGGKKMTSMAEFLKEQGFEKGVVVGIEQGRKESLENIVNAMISCGYPIEEVQKITQFSQHKILRMITKTNRSTH